MKFPQNMPMFKVMGGRVRSILLALLALAPSARLAWTWRAMPQLGMSHDDALYLVSAQRFSPHPVDVAPDIRILLGYACQVTLQADCGGRQSFVFCGFCGERLRLTLLPKFMQLCAVGAAAHNPQPRCGLDEVTVNAATTLHGYRASSRVTLIGLTRMVVKTPKRAEAPFIKSSYRCTSPAAVPKPFR
jgi:hypothetical protein